MFHRPHRRLSISKALEQFRPMGDMEAYAQSKLAMTAWSRYLANDLTNGPSVISVNPGSFVGDKNGERRVRY